MALSHRQRRFVQEYLRSKSATEAALRAGYSASSAKVTASQLMHNADILEAIEDGQKERLDRVEIDADYLLKRLHEEVEADVADLYDEVTGDLLPVHEWPEIWRRGLVAGVEIEALFDGRGEDRKQIGYTRKVKLSDRARRLEALGRHVSVSAFRDALEVRGFDGLADRLARAGGLNADPECSPSRPAAQPPEPATELPAGPMDDQATLPVRCVNVPADAGSAAIIAATPEYRPVLPWPDEPGRVTTEYDPLKY